MANRITHSTLNSGLVAHWTQGTFQLSLHYPSLQVQIKNSQISTQPISSAWVKGIPIGLKKFPEEGEAVFKAFCASIYPLIRSSKENYSVEFLPRLLGAGKFSIPKVEVYLIDSWCRQEYDTIMNDPEELCCSITHELLQDPVVDSAGNTYERAAIEKWFKEHPNPLTSPLTGENLTDDRLTPNKDKKRSLEQWKDQCIQKGLRLLPVFKDKKCFQTAFQVLDRLENIQKNPRLAELRAECLAAQKVFEIEKIEKEKASLTNQIACLKITFQAAFEECYSVIESTLMWKITEINGILCIVFADPSSGKIYNTISLPPGATRSQISIKYNTLFIIEHKSGGESHDSGSRWYSWEINSLPLDGLKTQQKINFRDRISEFVKFRHNDKVYPELKILSANQILIADKLHTYTYQSSRYRSFDDGSYRWVSENVATGQLKSEPFPSYTPPPGFLLTKLSQPIFEFLIPQDFSIEWGELNAIKSRKGYTDDIIIQHKTNKIKCLFGKLNDTNFHCFDVHYLELPNLDKSRLNAYLRLLNLLLEDREFETYIHHSIKLIYFHQYNGKWEIIESIYSSFSLRETLIPCLEEKIQECLKNNQKSKAAGYYTLVGLHQSSFDKKAEYYQKSVDLNPTNEINHLALNYSKMIKEGVSWDSIETELLTIASKSSLEAQEAATRLTTALKIREKQLMSSIDKKIEESIAKALQAIRPSLPALSSQALDSKSSSSVAETALETPEKAKK